MRKAPAECDPPLVNSATHGILLRIIADGRRKAGGPCAEKLPLPFVATPPLTPFTRRAARLFAYASTHVQLPIRQYVFRSMAPCFVGQAIRLGHGESRGELRATRCDGVIAMEATAQ